MTTLAQRALFRKDGLLFRMLRMSPSMPHLPHVSLAVAIVCSTLVPAIEAQSSDTTRTPVAPLFTALVVFILGTRQSVLA